MAIFNFKKREIECKIVYYGPGRCGKTTNMEYIYKTLKNRSSARWSPLIPKVIGPFFLIFFPWDLGR